MKPFKHQLAALEKSKGMQAFGYFMDCGTGKTYTSIWKAFEEHTSHNLVVTFNSIKYNWADQLKKLGETDIIILDGARDKKIKALRNHRWKWVIINYDALISLIEELLAEEFDGIILDESTAIKNHKAKRTKACWKLGKGKSVILKLLLTGTPITQSPLDVWSPMRFLNENILGTNWFSFLYEYAVTMEKFVSGHRFKEVVGYKNIDKLIKKIEPYCFFCKKEDCLDLPEKVYEIREVEMPDEMKRLYKELNLDFISELNSKEIIKVDNAMAKAVRLHQMLGGNVCVTGIDSLSNTWKKIEENKTKVLLDLLQNEIADDKKVVVFCQFINEVKYVHEKLNSENINTAMIYGAVEVEDRNKILQAFLHDKNPRVVVAQSSVCGYGINEMVAASYAVYYSSEYSYLVRTQSEDRLHRHGQKNMVTIIDLVTKLKDIVTIDEMVLNAHKKGKSFEEYLKEIKWEDTDA